MAKAGTARLMVSHSAASEHEPRSTLTNGSSTNLVKTPAVTQSEMNISDMYVESSPWISATYGTATPVPPAAEGSPPARRGSRRTYVRPVGGRGGDFNDVGGASRKTLLRRVGRRGGDFFDMGGRRGGPL